MLLTEAMTGIRHKKHISNKHKDTHPDKPENILSIYKHPFVFFFF